MSKEAYNELIGWLPMLLLIGAWLFFMWQLRNNGKPQSGKSAGGIGVDQLSELRRRNEALEKIVKDHDARLQSLERTRNL